jgi:8-oxo-dGTP diphosphatase
MVIQHNSAKQIIKAASACVWRADHVLLVQRGKSLGYGTWSLPGGKVEPDESLIAAAARELLEETGVIGALVHSVGDFTVTAGGAHYVISCFSGAYVSGQALAMSDAKDVAWVHWQEIASKPLAPNTTEAVALARKFISV